MRTKPVTLTVTEAHYKKAVTAAKRGADVTETCVMAQALKGRFPKLARRVSCAWTTGSVGDQNYDFDKNGLTCTTLFTNPSDRHILLALLPLKVVVTPFKQA
jgi:hypothetical protein